MGAAMMPGRKAITALSALLATVTACPYMDALGTAEAISSGCPFAALTEVKGPNTTDVHAIPSHVEVKPDPGQTTVKGCECQSSCGATIDDGFNCDWCTTKDNCGSHSIVYGYYDYCVYPDTAAFEKMSFQDKNTYFQSQIDKDHTRLAAYASPTVILSESSQTSFWDYQDELPAGRVKGIHSIGAVCQFTLGIDAGSPYSGLFAPGPQLGFVRWEGPLHGIRQARVTLQAWASSSLALVSHLGAMSRWSLWIARLGTSWPTTSVTTSHLQLQLPRSCSSKSSNKLANVLPR